MSAHHPNTDTLTHQTPIETNAFASYPLWDKVCQFSSSCIKPGVRSARCSATKHGLWLGFARSEFDLNSDTNGSTGITMFASDFARNYNSDRKFWTHYNWPQTRGHGQFSRYCNGMVTGFHGTVNGKWLWYRGNYLSLCRAHAVLPTKTDFILIILHRTENPTRLCRKFQIWLKLGFSFSGPVPDMYYGGITRSMRCMYRISYLPLAYMQRSYLPVSWPLAQVEINFSHRISFFFH